ncbi:YceI family protein [Saxibacter everestensis]|uniref:YceI family protein n=1 Tax=Saxibacter everestensis TaxID=2909229 RepID=A0ABY8QYB2_9MICO|nr:YceI family protein [Brevibacteriaceae bacterium ZFBP1038]
MTVPSGLTKGTWTLDGAHSEVGFAVRHAGISKVRGSFDLVEAGLNVGDSLADSSVTAVAKADSFNSGDDNRDAHVRGEDFFDTAKFPELSFASTGLSGDGEAFKLAGDLTIRGITKPVTFDAEFNGVAVDAFGTTRTGISANTVISRKEFGLTWNAALEAGGVLVSDKVAINLDVAFVAPSE